MKGRTTRAGLTLIELIAVLAVLGILAVIVLPSMDAMYGDTRQKGAADQIRGELATARAWAMDDGVPYRVAVSDDGTKIRRAPEEGFADASPTTEFNSSARCVEYTFDKVTATVQPGTDGVAPPSEGGWVTVAVALADGTCRADRGTNPTFTVVLKDAGQDKPGLQVSIRALTGQTRIGQFKTGAQQ